MEKCGSWLINTLQDSHITLTLTVVSAWPTAQDLEAYSDAVRQRIYA